MMMAPALRMPLDHHAVGRRHEILQDRRALGHRHALDRGEVLHRLGKAVQRADVRTLGKLGVARARLGEKCRAVAQRDDRVDRGIELLDLVEIGGHHLDAGHLPRADRAGERDGIHHHDIGCSARCGFRFSGRCAHASVLLRASVSGAMLSSLTDRGDCHDRHHRHLSSPSRRRSKRSPRPSSRPRPTTRACPACCARITT